jgi:hypothetical protein
MQVGLLTGVGAAVAGSVLSGLIFSGPVNRAHSGSERQHTGKQRKSSLSGMMAFAKPFPSSARLASESRATLHFSEMFECHRKWLSHGRPFVEEREPIDGIVSAVERQPPCPRATTTLAVFQAAEVGVFFGFLG